MSLGSSLGRGGSSFRRSGLGRSCGAVGSGAAAASRPAAITLAIARAIAFFIVLVLLKMFL